MISLRQATPEDAGMLATWFNDRENTGYMEDARESYDEDYVRERIEPCDFIIMLDEKAIGYCSLYDLNGGSAEISILIGDRDELGKGYGKIALDILCAFAFERLGLEELHASIDEDNVSSLRMVEGCGFSRVGKRGRDLLFVKRRS